MAAYFVVFSFIVFVLLMGPSQKFRNGPIGMIHRFLTVTLVNGIASVNRRICGTRLSGKFDGIYRYLMEEKNPALQMVYLFLITGAVYAFYVSVWPHIPGPYLSRIHLYTSNLIIIFTYATMFIASRSDPGRVTRENVFKACKAFQYDLVLFEPKQCRTCLIQKPARSKHCSLCNVCVAKCDHHCAWINNCVGLKNYRYFLLFLYATIQICFYGTYLVVYAFMGIAKDMNLMSAYVSNIQTGKSMPITTYQAVLFLIHQQRLLGALGIFAFLVGFVILAFLGYQLSLIKSGMTANEAFKWEDLDEIIQMGELYMHEKEFDVDDAKLAKHAKISKKIKLYWNETAEERKQRLGGPRGKNDYDGTQVQSVKEVENIFDKGFWGNLKEIFFPPSIDN
ncbi:4766_t:CDS:2 [Paraglomus brasilianum]|uniref:Palmitoyltransferase n=1 Tax=Paraglomus brasilianum TaxID=144538 RepID=A0A9N8Z6V4_9GLOM|nr:4766_t:CDS:2 [Paraglomus brasilianum]